MSQYLRLSQLFCFLHEIRKSGIFGFGEKEKFWVREIVLGTPTVHGK
jgi:hypothetical protein